MHFLSHIDLSLPDLYSALISADAVIINWETFVQKLGVVNHEKITDDIYMTATYNEECFYYVLEAWLMKEEGTGDLPRTWDTVLTTLKDSDIPIAAAQVEESLVNQQLS